MKLLYYLLDDDHNPIATDNVLKWAQMFESSDRVVAQTNVTDDIRVSTVFLGIDHGNGEGEPILFETIVFGGEHDGRTERYSTWNEAQKGHNNIVADELWLAGSIGDK